ncbi:hypothetical protein [Mesorhizobium amorphae]|uniref:hypothetical protein n=1 Tax=Mesorhizobium amorphae TaxID=71433 RepID=UPI001781305F|nr:hypothetical protein [Mesorhizobium amorphae]
MERVKAIAKHMVVFFGVLVAFDLAVYAYIWGQRGTPSLHTLWLAIAAVVIAIFYATAKNSFAGNERIGWFARLYLPPWSAFEPFFKGSRLLLPIVVLSYVLFYITEALNQGSLWAGWVNNHVLNFYLSCHKFTAVDVIRIEIGGFTLYLALYGLYLFYCPQILTHAVRKGSGLAREDAALVLVDTIEDHGTAVPPNDLAATIEAFAGENRGLFDKDRQTLLNHRLESLQLTSQSDPPSPLATAADAAGVARLFPTSLATESYYLGRDLFDILYPAVRSILCLGLAVALLATSLPVAAKLLWVALPRLGEECMVDIVQVPPSFRDSEWIEFEGREESRNAQEVVLIPEDDAGERWHLVPEDVTQIDVHGIKRTLVRKGGEIRAFKRVFGSVASPLAPGFPSRMSQQCSTAGSRCSNHIEICCGSNSIVGNCYGRWSCPAP